MTDIDELVKRMRLLDEDHGPDGWPAVRTHEISTLCDAIEGAIPSLDLLQKRLEAGATIKLQDGCWWLFDKSGCGITSGTSLRLMLMNLIFVDC
jgi:hypothetical protein